MTSEKIFCQNCGHELEDGSNICKRCNLVAAHNLENFLISKYKLLAVIGVFAALSVYLSSNAISHENNGFLVYGSYLSLSIVILLSTIFGWEIVWYSRKILQFNFDGEDHNIEWFRRGFQFATIFLFIIFFVVIIGFISLYILSTDKTIATSLVLTIFIDFLFFLTISTFYFPIRSLIESKSNLIRFFVLFGLIFFQFLTIYFYFKGHTDDIFGLILPIFMISIDYVLIIRSSWLIFMTMTEDEMPILRKKLKKEVFMIEVLRKKIQAVRDTDVNALLFGGIGLLGIFLGSIVINLNPPSYQIGYPTMALGLTCFIFAVSIDNSKKTGKKMESILENQHLILEEIKKNRGSE